MAHFAQLDENNVVTQVIVVNNNELLDENGVEQEAKGIVFCQSLFGETTHWVKTSYNASIRKNYAGIGFIFDESKNAFIPPKPYPSWVLNETTCTWKAPIECPNDGKNYNWDEKTTSWIEIQNG